MCWSGLGAGGTNTMVQLKNREPIPSAGDAISDEFAGDAALPAGLSLILADAARSHLKAGDLKTATACLEEAERLMSLLPGSKPD